MILKGINKVAFCCVAAICLTFSFESQAKPKVFLYGGIMAYTRGVEAVASDLRKSCGAEVKINPSSDQVRRAARSGGPVIVGGHSMGASQAARAAESAAPSKIALFVAFEPMPPVGKPNNVTTLKIYRSSNYQGSWHVSIASDKRVIADVRKRVCG